MATDNPRETMLRLMNLPASRFNGVVRTDGDYIAQAIGDIGYNHFLGKPAPIHDGPGLDNTLRIWNALTAEEQAQVRAVAACPMDGQPIPLEDFGVPSAN